jgi:hypothetical protein
MGLQFYDAFLLGKFEFCGPLENTLKKVPLDIM